MKSKSMRKVLVGLMAAALLIGNLIGSTAVKADTVIGPSPTTGSLTINKTDGEGTPLGGAVFTLYKIMDITPGTTAGDYADYTVASHYASALTGVTPDTLGNYSAAQIEAKVNQLLALTATDTTGTAMPATSGTTGQSTLNNLDLGYYIVVETTTPAGYVAGSPFFVAIPSTNNYNNNQAAGTEWVYNVTVAPKNQEVPLEKNIITGQDETTGDDILSGTDTATIGDDVKFVVDAMIPNFTDEYFANGGVPVYKVTDTMSTGLTFNNDITVALVDSDGSETLVAASAATWQQTTGTGVDFVVTFAKDFLEANRGAYIRVYYSAELNANAVLGNVGNTNHVELTYSNNPQDLTECGTEEADSTVYSFAIAIEKYAEGTQALLEGAEFGLYKEAACTNAVFTPATLTTNASGILQFPGVSEGVYYLKEVTSPNGYKLLTNPIKIEIKATIGADGELDGGFELEVDGTPVTATSGTLVTKLNEDTGISTIAVENKKGFTLPATGGMGIAIFLIIGISGLLVLSVAMMRKKKRSSL